MSAKNGHIHPRNSAPTMELVSITPELAKVWLGSNLVNRHVRKSVVARYAADMVAGRWRGADSMFILRTDGVLLDGQHRLLAIVESGVTVEAWVQTKDAFLDPMDLRADTGITRSAVDILGVTTNLAAVARVLYLMATKRSGPSIDVVHDICDVIAPDFERLTRTTRRGFTTAPVMAAVCFSIHRYPSDTEEIARQYHSLAAEQNDGDIWPGFYSAARQTIEGSYRGRASTVETFLRVARGLGVSRGNQKITFKDPDIYRSEIEPLIRKYVQMDAAVPELAVIR